MSKDLIYKNVDSLKPIENILEEAGKAIQDKYRTTSDNDEIKEVLAAAGGISAGAGVGFAGLYFGGVTGLSAAGISSGLAAAGGLVGGGMAAGVAVLAAPAAIIGVGAYAFVSKRNKKRLIEKKQMLLQEALRKQNAIIGELRKESTANRERADYLTKLNVLLQAAVQDLKADLGTE
ncbi:hypothetical protein HJ030_21120 [Vibrio parahaemolyticus]|uniref:hypothetical protein n=1 Tax=Vibrio parahaemolyticus TaxID=670 RepID=UPI00186A2906|nr:hypothetical protein [Vibrio parahaemolyticus]EHR6713955.1 hypothetical protein [Vibrio parahaemolyticus]MBE4385638.1 hypothetical protein [Vibrio parahaemolyticus]HCE1969742.1 hypothetical protein [Vibrio parahaemolyticus]HCG8413934.1 hypothetical protein [Vibrio parahaemolyticus]